MLGFFEKFLVLESEKKWKGITPLNSKNGFGETQIERNSRTKFFHNLKKN